jgi:uncharacterized membrane protein
VVDRLTLATASGFPLLSLAFHVAAGVAALVAGYIAIAARKGGTWHRRSGTVFVYAMLAMGLAAVGIAVYEGKEDVAGGALTAYLIFTAWTTVRPVRVAGRAVDVALMVFVSLLGAATFARGLAALDRPGNQMEGVPAGMLFFLATVFLLAGIGDARVILAGGIQGSRRIARHLWRMCFGLFIASGSFVAQLAMMQGAPGWMRSVPVIVILGAAPLVVLVYWMWRVRLRRNLRGLLTATPLDAPKPA